MEPVKLFARGQARPTASLYAAVRSDWACCATASPGCRDPDAGKIVPAGKPVIAVPVQTPTSPVTTVRPALVTVEPPRTPNVAAAPNDMFCANAGKTTQANTANPRIASQPGEFLLDLASAP